MAGLAGSQRPAAEKAPWVPGRQEEAWSSSQADFMLYSSALPIIQHSLPSK